MLNYFLDGFLKIFKKITRSPEEGGASIVFLATGDEVKCKSKCIFSSGCNLLSFIFLSIFFSISMKALLEENKEQS